jgi:hypothetical protein
MTRYFTNFEDADIGSLPTGWTRRWNAITDPSSFQYAVQYSDVPFKRRLLKPTLGAVTTWGALSFDAVDVDPLRADIDIVALQVVPASGLPSDDFIVFRASGSAGSETAYACGFNYGGNNFNLFKLVSAAVTNLGSVNEPLGFDAGDRILIHVRAIGTSLKARYWFYGDPEPSTWHIEVTDAGIPAAGWQGFWDYAGGSVSSAGWNFLSVATDGETAFIPILNDEFLDWLDQQDVVRCVLAEMRANGFEAGGIGSPPTYVTPVNAYASNIGYTSQASDNPPNQHYPAIMCKVPTIRRALPESLVGGASISFGDLVLSNPREAGQSNDTPGIRDDWLRARWVRDDVKIYLGDPEWEKDSFRLVLWGRIGQPTAPSRDQIQFRIADVMDALNVPLTTSRINAGGDFDGQFEPVVLGSVAFMEPPEISPNVFQVDGGEIALDSGTPGNIADNFIFSNANSIISSVADNTITANSHGMFEDWRVRFDDSPAPAPLILGQDYWVAASGLTPNTFQVSAQKGGAVINLTNTTAGATVSGYNATFDFDEGTFELATDAVGRVLGVALHKDNGESGAEAKIPNMYEDIFFRLAGISENRKLTDSFTTLRTAMDANSLRGGLWFDTRSHQCKEAAEDLAKGSNTFFGATADGLLYVGRFGLPATAVLGLDEGDIADGSLKLEQVFLPINFEEVEFAYQPIYLTQGPGQGAIAPLFTQGKYFLPAFSYGPAGTPLDDYPNQMECRAPERREVLFPVNADTERERLAELFKTKSGIFKVDTVLRSIYRDDGTPLQLGDTISLSCSRLGWKLWTASDPASPDNLATVDSRLAIVVGIDFTAAGGGAFPVALKLWRPMPGYFAEDALN